MTLFSGQESLLFSTSGSSEPPYRGNQGKGLDQRFRSVEKPRMSLVGRRQRSHRTGKS